MFEELVARAQGLADGATGRLVLGVAGAPGSGKSTLALALCDALDPTGTWAARVPMDGFHLADEALDRLGLRQCKGAIETFDAFGFSAIVGRLRVETSHVVYVPSFDRDLEQPIAGAAAIAPEVRLVVIEGNYLLMPEEPWLRARREMAEVWYLEADGDLRRRRLVDRHVRFGKSPGAATAWVDEVDESNARLVAAHRDDADLVIDAEALELPAGSVIDGRT